MTSQQIIDTIAPLIELSENDRESERPKVEFKRIWYNLKSDQGVAEFLKDSSALVNTVGLDGYIIIGFDTKDPAFKYPTVFKDSGLKDFNELRGILVKGLSEAFDIDLYSVKIKDYDLDVLHIPPSLNKPHVIKLHRSFDKDGNLKKTEENRILVRKNTGIYPATKYDIDFMYYDRKNIIPEYELHGFIDLTSLNLSVTPGPHEIFGNVCTRIHGQLSITLENSGRRPISVKEVMCVLSMFDDNPSTGEFLTIKSIGTTDNCIIPPNLISHIRFFVESDNLNGIHFDTANSKVSDFLRHQKYLLLKNFVVHTTNGFILYPKSTNK